MSVEYGDGTRAVDSLTFSVERGENVALIGANGAGKTSLLLALAGVLPMCGGTVEADGVVMGKKTLQIIRQRVGLVFQNPDDQLFMPNIYEDIAFGPRNFGCTEEETRERTEEALTWLGILPLAQRSPLKMSGGERRLAALATVLAMRPDYMLFDEPTAFLDPRARRALTELLLRLPQGKIVATHDLALAADTCPRVLLLQAGRLIADGGADILRDDGALRAAGL
jgi:cobalt/nickel transport system ATP-binding protein